MNRTILIAVAVVIVALGGWLLWRGHEGGGGNAASTTPAVTPVVITETPGVEVQYLNTALKFSFGMPDGVYAQEFPGTSGIVVRLHQADSSTHLAVFVTPSKTDPAVFTADTVTADAPGTSVTDAAAASMPGGVTALEFTSSSTAWGGPSRELWFAYNGNRYQVSVPLVDAKLLDFVRDSWQWRK
jgi:hypothetical protein